MSIDFWRQLKLEAENLKNSEPLLSSYVHTCILAHHNFETALGFILSNKLADTVMSSLTIKEIFEQCYLMHPEIAEAAMVDIQAVFNRDPAVTSNLTVLLNFKGFQAIQVHRLANQLWKTGRKDLALFIQSRNSEAFSVDIHPAAHIGQGVMFDHATGIVVGETAVIDDNVSIMQSVTLGGTGNEAGDRHPKIREGVMIGAGAKILGNITIGEGVKVGAGSVVLNDVPAHVTVAGIPAKIVGKPTCQKPCETMQQNILED
ncbi:serine O-acetyltransferase [Paraglaciecola aquimarina]|uniref:Serine acetyltransferase n=1 Tax=Paraglaciecola aquimarina TaxID=1235557 RepID=A0ABU3ST03_9ALTE|nr:serine O-acetyltransferase [Paraglaciecola aquimarina]MDU0353146.1 serine O-acetyltransferase [Paraglaciecola aquimarina]